MGENQNIVDKNKQLELENKALVKDSDDKMSAMGEDMGNLIHKHKFQREIALESDRYAGAVTNGFGYEGNSIGLCTPVVMLILRC